MFASRGNAAVDGIDKINLAPVADTSGRIWRNVGRVKGADRSNQWSAARWQFKVFVLSFGGRLMTGNAAADDVKKLAALRVCDVPRQIGGGERRRLRQNKKNSAAENAQKRRGGENPFQFET